MWIRTTPLNGGKKIEAFLKKPRSQRPKEASGIWNRYKENIPVSKRVEKTLGTFASWSTSPVIRIFNSLFVSISFIGTRKDDDTHYMLNGTCESVFTIKMFTLAFFILH